MERIFAPGEIMAPAIQVSLDKPAQRGNSQMTLVENPGPVVRTRRTEIPGDRPWATLNHAVLETGSLQPRLSDLHEKVRAPRSGTRYLFLIDSSGSHAAQQKMRLVKGAILSILNRSFRKDDEVVFIGFRGTNARVLLEPSHQIDDAATALEYLPTGGRTPLAHALELAKTYLTPSAFLTLVSDGPANISLRGDDPWREALTIAQEFNCRALVIDTETPEHRIGRISELALVLRASLIPLAEIEDLEVLEIKEVFSQSVSTTQNSTALRGFQTESHGGVARLSC